LIKCFEFKSLTILNAFRREKDNIKVHITVLCIDYGSVDFAFRNKIEINVELMFPKIHNKDLN
jgi:hypothetical protein